MVIVCLNVTLYMVFSKMGQLLNCRFSVPFWDISFPNLRDSSSCSSHVALQSSDLLFGPNNALLRKRTFLNGCLQPFPLTPRLPNGQQILVSIPPKAQEFIVLL